MERPISPEDKVQKYNHTSIMPITRLCDFMLSLCWLIDCSNGCVDTYLMVFTYNFI